MNNASTMDLVLNVLAMFIILTLILLQKNVQQLQSRDETSIKATPLQLIYSNDEYRIANHKFKNINEVVSHLKKLNLCKDEQTVNMLFPSPIMPLSKAKKITAELSNKTICQIYY